METLISSLNLFIPILISLIIHLRRVNYFDNYHPISSFTSGKALSSSSQWKTVYINPSKSILRTGFGHKDSLSLIDEHLVCCRFWDCWPSCHSEVLERIGGWEHYFKIVFFWYFWTLSVALKKHLVGPFRIILRFYKSLQYFTLVAGSALGRAIFNLSFLSHCS